MGEVYLAQDMRLNRPVALKLLTADLTRYEDRLRRFEQEARAASALNHPNILTIYEIGHAPPGHFIATEFIDGETLRQHIAHAQIRLVEALDISIQVSAALAAAHAAGIVHRDIKPENIMVDRTASQSLDFGGALPAAAIDSEAPTIRPYYRPETIMGTSIHVAGAGVGWLEARTDIWSWAACLTDGRWSVTFEGRPAVHDRSIWTGSDSTRALLVDVPMIDCDIKKASIRTGGRTRPRFLVTATSQQEWAFRSNSKAHRRRAVRKATASGGGKSQRRGAADCNGKWVRRAYLKSRISFGRSSAPGGAQSSRWRLRQSSSASFHLNRDLWRTCIQ